MLVLDVVHGVGRNLSHPVAQQLESLVEQFNPDYNRKNKQRTKEVWGPKLMKSKAPHAHQSGNDVLARLLSNLACLSPHNMVCSLSVVRVVWTYPTLPVLQSLRRCSGVARSCGAASHAADMQDRTLLCADGLFNLVDYSVHANPLPLRNAKEAVELLGALPYIRVDMADQAKETFKKQLQQLLETHYEAGKFDFPLETKLFILRPIDSRESSDQRHSGHEGQVPFQFFPNRTT